MSTYRKGRLPPIEPDDLTPAQREVFDAIVGGKRGQGRSHQEFLGPDGALRGPFNAFLRVPGAGLALQRVGEVLRFEGELPGDLRELVILMVAHKYRAEFEWWAHAPLAVREGLNQGIVDALGESRAPAFDDARQALVYEFTSTTLGRNRVDAALYERAKTTLGENATVELVFVIGYYAALALVLNVFEVPSPNPEHLPFPLPGP